MSESAPTNNTPKFLEFYWLILASLFLILAGVVGYNYYHPVKPTEVFTPKVIPVPVINAPVVIPGDEPIVVKVIKPEPVVQAPVVQTVKPVTVSTGVAITPEPKTVTAPPVVSPVSSHPIPYLNHGIFVHGNSNPNWPR